VITDFHLLPLVDDLSTIQSVSAWMTTLLLLLFFLLLKPNQRILFLLFRHSLQIPNRRASFNHLHHYAKSHPQWIMRETNNPAPV